jgi:hypothetical protein
MRRRTTGFRAVDLTFDLDPAKTMVINRMQVERNADVARQPLRLHGEALNLTRVLIDGESVSFRHEDGLLVIDTPDAAAFTLEVRNTCAPDKNTALSGLYTSGGGFFTQCEAQGFRRITYFLDRPDVMAVYTVTLRACKAAYPVLLSNGNLVEQRDLENGRHVAEVARPVSEAELPVRPGRRRPGRARAAHPHARRQEPSAAGLRATRRSRQDRARDELAGRGGGLGRGALRACPRPRALHDRRGRRLQHRGDGEQGPQHLQHQVRAGRIRRRRPMPTTARSNRWSATSTSTTGPATGSPAATGSS